MDRTAEQLDHVLAGLGSACSRKEEVNLAKLLRILRRRKWLIEGTIELLMYYALNAISMNHPLYLRGNIRGARA